MGVGPLLFNLAVLSVRLHFAIRVTISLKAGRLCGDTSMRSDLLVQNQRLISFIREDILPRDKIMVEKHRPIETYRNAVQ